MSPASGSRRPRKGAKKAQPFIIEPVRGGFAVSRRPVGNLAIPRLCGTMPTRPKAVELARLLARAESAAPDLFLEATDDGIEALEAVIAACLGAASGGGERTSRRRSAARADAPAGDEAASPYGEGDGRPRRGVPGRRRGRRGRGGPGGSSDAASDV